MTTRTSAVAQGREAIFPKAEFDRRIEAARHLLAERSIDVLTGPENIFYLAGQQTPGYYTFQALLLPVDGAPVFIVGRYDMQIHRGRRSSTARAYLHPATNRQNLTVEIKALATRVLFERTRAVGVKYIQRSETHRACAEREVILCGGAINSPQLLMLSGVGDPDHLRDMEIAVVVPLTGVGQNLQDHLNSAVKHECAQPITLYGADRPLRAFTIGLQYLVFKTGAGATMHTESGSFLKTRDDVETPDIQHHFITTLVEDHGRKPADRHGFQAHVCQLRPTSRGFIKLKSPDPRAHPLIQPNYLDTEEDRRILRDAIRVTREIFAQKAFDPYRGPELHPGPDIESDRDIDAFLRESAVTCYHPGGTCKMGVGDTAVVDAELVVRGITCLRVVDASIMPNLVSGNTNAPVIMIAEKAADIILGKPPLPAEHVPVAGI